jgi:hypothetical protein
MKPRFRYRLRVVIAWFAFVALPGTLVAQSPLAAINGVVTENDHPSPRVGQAFGAGRARAFQFAARLLF